MKKILLLILLCAAFCFNGWCGQAVTITSSGDELTIKRGDHVFVAQIVGDYQQDLRIFGITDNSGGGWNPMAYANYIFMAQVFNGNIEDCERGAALSAPLLNMIIENAGIKADIHTLEGMSETRRSATIIGRKLRIKEFYYKEKDHSDSLKKQGQMDPSSAIIIDEIKILE